METKVAKDRLRTITTQQVTFIGESGMALSPLARKPRLTRRCKVPTNSVIDAQGGSTDIVSVEQLPDVSHKLQKRLSSLVSTLALSSLLEISNKLSKARIRSAGSSEAGAWLNLVPSSQGVSFTNIEFQTAVALRLGLPVPLL